MTKIENQREFIQIGIGVLTISDSRTIETDRSGDVLCQRIEESGHKISARKIVKDEIDDIQNQIFKWVRQSDIDAIITTGGTGLTGRDVTPEAVSPLLDKVIDGFGTLFHHISYQKIGTSTVQSRALAGLIRTTFVFCLPGSPGACKDAWDGILKQQLDYRHLPCNFIEIMPRLDEQLKRKKS